MIPVNVRLPEGLIKPIDEWVNEGRFASRSEAIKSMVFFYEEREKTASFLDMLNQRSKESREHPEELVPLDKLK
jgi:Arc/MetJ-type ribon-helix-helix transcriptional regulator